MPTLRFWSISSVFVSLLVTPFAGTAQSKNETNFPTDEEIRLVITQIDRAMQQFKPLLDQEEALLGGEGKEATAEDRQVVGALETASKTFKKNP
jgi:hypothetical protein